MTNDCSPHIHIIYFLKLKNLKYKIITKPNQSQVQCKVVGIKTNRKIISRYLAQFKNLTGNWNDLETVLNHKFSIQNNVRLLNVEQTIIENNTIPSTYYKLWQIENNIYHTYCLVIPVLPRLLSTIQLIFVISRKIFLMCRQQHQSSFFLITPKIHLKCFPFQRADDYCQSNT